MSIFTSCLLLVLCLPLFVWIFSFIAARLDPVHSRSERTQAYREYLECLNKLKAEPGNHALLELTRETARFYVNESRDEQGDSAIDQVRLQREIDVAFYGRDQKAG
jgi:hypothetical protein